MKLKDALKFNCSKSRQRENLKNSQAREKLHKQRNKGKRYSRFLCQKQRTKGEDNRKTLLMS